MEAAAVEDSYCHAIHIAPNSDCQGAEYPVYQVNGGGSHRIIDLEYFIDELDGQDNEDTGYRPNDYRIAGDTTAQGAVIATRPARQPFSVIEASGFLNQNQEKISAETAPAEPPRWS